MEVLRESRRRGSREERISVKIYTRTGDGGETSLFGGGRVAKDHGRVTAYGTVEPFMMEPVPRS